MQRLRIIQLFMAFVTIFSVVMPNVSSAQASTGTSTQIFDTNSTSTRFVDVVVGDNHTCALKANGTVMCWGWNGEGQLGINDGTVRFSSVPVDVLGISSAVAISAGANNTCVILRDANIACWGYGYFGDGGHMYSRWYPSQVAGLRDITKLAMSNKGTCATNVYGALLCWGEHIYYHSEFWLPYANNSETVYTWPRNAANGDFMQIAVRNVDRNRRYCMLKSDGKLTCNGVNAEGHLGLGFNSNYNHQGLTVVGLGNYTRKFALSSNGGCAILTDATVSCWGSMAGAYDSVARNINMPEPMVDVSGSTQNR